MKRTFPLFIVLFLTTQFFSWSDLLKLCPSFRGVFAKGFIEGANTVSNWTIETGENVFTSNFR